MKQSKTEEAAARRTKDLLWTSSTYFAEGLPWSIMHQVAAEFFTAIGAPAAKVGYTSLLHGPTLLKVVWSPVVGLFGTLRGWMVSTQASMGVLVGLLSVLAHQVAGREGDASDTTWIWVLLVLLGVLSAMHDIACDGYYMEALDKKDQARLSGLRVAAFRAAMLVGSSGLVFLAGTVNWLLAFLAGAFLLSGLALFHALWLPRSALRTGPSTSKSGSLTPDAPAAVRAPLIESYTSFFRQEAVFLVIAFLMTYKMADVLMFSMSKVLLGRELGIGTDLRGVIGFFSTISSIFGAVLGGAWIARRGLVKSLVPITLLMALTEPLFALLASWAPELSLAESGEPVTLALFSWQRDGFTILIATVVVVIEQVCGGLATAAQMVFIMRRCHVAHKTAHFAFATALYSAAQMAVGAGSGHLFETVGSVSYFWIVSAMTLPAVALAFAVPKD